MARSMVHGQSSNSGTTIIGMEFHGGVILAADSHTTLAYETFNKVPDKMIHITERVYAGRSGSPEDFKEICSEAKISLEKYESETGKKAEVVHVAVVFRSICIKNLKKYSSGMIVAGWDEKRGGQVYLIDGAGDLIRKKVATEGSRANFILAVLNMGYRPGMQSQDCLQVMINAIKRDARPSSVARTLTVTRDRTTVKILIK